MDITITSAVGAVLSISGLIVVTTQLLSKREDPTQSRRMETEAGPVRSKLTTIFPGLLVIALGVILLIIAATTEQ